MGEWGQGHSLGLWTWEQQKVLTAPQVRVDVDRWDLLVKTATLQDWSNFLCPVSTLSPGSAAEVQSGLGLTPGAHL